MKKREDVWQRKTFSLSEESIQKIKEGCEFTGLNESNYIEFLVMQQAETFDPIEQLQNSNKKIKDMREALQKEEQKNQIFAENLSSYQKWLKQKQDKKPEAIKIISRRIAEREYREAESKAKTWSKILGISPIVLLAEAHEQINGTIQKTKDL